MVKPPFMQSLWNVSGMGTTALKAEMLQFPQIKLNKIQQKSLLFQCKISHIQYLGWTTAITKQSTLMKTVVSNIIALFFSNYGELDLLQELLYVTYALRCQARERVIYREVACPFSCTTVSFRGRFRGGDLVICHPLFSDMTLQNQILVIEPLFLTSDV